MANGNAYQEHRNNQQQYQFEGETSNSYTYRASTSHQEQYDEQRGETVPRSAVGTRNTLISKSRSSEVDQQANLEPNQLENFNYVSLMLIDEELCDEDPFKEEIKLERN